QVFLARDTLAFEFQAYQPGAGQSTDEQAVLPARERIARVPLRTGGCDDGIPVIHRLREAFRCRRGPVDRIAAVFDAVCLYRPAVVHARTDEVQLIAAARA